jgi:hypothetical protein
MEGIDLKIARIRQGRRQLDLARTTGIHATRLSKIENGWEKPQPEERRTILTALKLEDAATMADAE